MKCFTAAFSFALLSNTDCVNVYMRAFMYEKTLNKGKYLKIFVCLLIIMTFTYYIHVRKYKREKMSYEYNSRGCVEGEGGG